MAAKKNIVTAVIVLVCIVLTLGCVGLINAKKKGGKGGSGGMPGMGGFPKGGSGRGGSVTSVRTVVAENSSITDYVTTNGEIETQASIEVFPSIGGKVVQMNVSLGSPVEKGDVIAYIDPSEAGSSYQKSPVVAPIAGSIISSPVKTGQKVTTGSVITKIGDIENLQVVAKVPERFVSELKIGQKAEISLEGYAGVVFSAYVVRISPVVDSATRTKEVILHFNHNDSRVNAGMFAKVKLYTTTYSGKPVIEQDAFVTVADKYYLYVVKDGEKQTVEKREVTLGKNIDGYYQVMTGINPGDEVVVAGMLTLYEGAAVKVIK